MEKLLDVRGVLDSLFGTTDDGTTKKNGINDEEFNDWIEKHAKGAEKAIKSWEKNMIIPDKYKDMFSEKQKKQSRNVKNNEMQNVNTKKDIEILNNNKTIKEDREY